MQGQELKRQRMPPEQKRDMDMLVRAVRRYVEKWERQEGYRHSKTKIVLAGDRYKPVSFESHFKRGGNWKKWHG